MNAKKAADIALKVLPFALLGVVGLQLYSCTQGALTMNFNDLNNADRCLSDVLDNKGVLRTPLPAWKDGPADASLMMLFNADSNAEKAAMLTPEIIAQCESLTGQTRSPEWDKLLSLRPR
ncbi:MAG: hypothetical protein KJ667_08585 [Alphaproteobacteria bacterium]|nr:hypothetical protein [Alphaproteobacteria bacterium]